jgi:hypothetical protein
MALFKCMRTNNTVEFENEWDISQMKSHPDYEEIKEEVKPAVKSKKTVTPSEEV